MEPNPFLDTNIELPPLASEQSGADRILITQHIIIANANQQKQLPLFRCRYVLVKASATNTGTIYVGMQGATADTGFAIAAGESMGLPIDSANKIWLKADVAGQEADIAISTSQGPIQHSNSSSNISQIGGTTQSGADVVDATNSALKVNVVAGGTAGGVAETQVRNSSGAWTDVGYASGNETMPVNVQYGTPSTQQVSVSSASAVQLPNLPGRLVTIKNDDASTVPVYIGGSSVTAATGFKLGPSGGFVVETTNSNLFYAITASGSATIDVLVMS